MEPLMSKTEPDRKDFARASPRQYFGKVAAIFLIVGPPTFGLIFYLAGSIANPNADTLNRKISEALGVVFSFYGLFASYVAGLVPSLMAGFVYARSYRHKGTTGHRFLVAALIGAAVYFLVCSLVLYFLYAGRIDPDAWLFTAYAAGAGAVSALLCALIVENC
jgi:uncharacterized membrane protein YeaQ/YmgE (transglycosylase-associated protein family)